MSPITKKDIPSEDRFDVAIVGAGPAGAIAANVLARKHRRVVLIDQARFPRTTVCSGWLSSRAEKLLLDGGVKLAGLSAQPFSDVTFFNADFTKSTKPAFKDPPGFLVDRTRFDNELVQAAVSHDVTFLQGCGVTGVQLKESAVSLTLGDGRRIESRLLLLASGRGSPLLESIGFPRQIGGTVMWTAQVSENLPSGSGGDPKVAVIFGLDGGGSFGLCCRSRERVTLDVNWIGPQEGALPALVRLCENAFRHQLSPVNLIGKVPTATVVRTPAAAALDMDSHVRKHTLLAGDAGGFVSAVSNEGIYPAMWSGRLAAEVLEIAVTSKHSQDALIGFDASWRVEMADYLRSPHTDVRFLLPLIFANQPMADRMGAAFFHGENI